MNNNNQNLYVAIGIPENRDVILKGMFWGFMRFLSSIRTNVIIFGNDDDCLVPGKTSYIDNMRNRIAERAIEEKCTHLFFIDSDTIPPPGALEMLLGADKDIVGGVYRFRVPPYRVLAFWHVSGHYVPMDKIPADELLKMDGIGMGCTLIKMNVLNKMEKPFFKSGYTNGKSPYTPNKSKKRYLGEDIYFCEKAKKLNFDIYLDTKVQCDHITQITIPGSLETPQNPWIEYMQNNKTSIKFGGQ